MTSPVSAVEAIEKAMEGVTPGPWDFEPISEHSVRPTVTTIGDYRVVRAGRGSRGYDLHGADEIDASYIAACNPGAMREVLALARQAEALTGIGSAHDLINDWLGEGTEDLLDDTPVRIEIGKRTIISDNLGSLRRARTLLKEEANAE